MPRIRTLKPELPHDKGLARVSRNIRYTFLLLLTQADDEGYFRANPRQLLGSIYPHDEGLAEADLVAELDTLIQIGVLEAFDTPDGVIGRITNFRKHQKIDHPSKPFLSTLSRTPRETFAKGVFSQESLVRSSVTNVTGENARRVISTQPPETAVSRQTLSPNQLHLAASRLMVAVRKDAYLGQPPAGYNPARDMTILKHWLSRGLPEAEIADAITGLRTAADHGDLDWIKPHAKFTLRALRGTKSGDRFVWDIATETAADAPPVVSIGDIIAHETPKTPDPF